MYVHQHTAAHARSLSRRGSRVCFPQGWRVYVPHSSVEHHSAPLPTPPLLQKNWTKVRVKAIADRNTRLQRLWSPPFSDRYNSSTRLPGIPAPPGRPYICTRAPHTFWLLASRVPPRRGLRLPPLLLRACYCVPGAGRDVDGRLHGVHQGALGSWCFKIRHLKSYPEETLPRMYVCTYIASYRNGGSSQPSVGAVSTASTARVTACLCVLL